MTVLDLAEPAFTFRAKPELDGALFQRELPGGAMFGEGHAVYSPQVNTRSRGGFHFSGTDANEPFSDNLNMAAPETSLWYLREWFATQGKIQRSLITELGWLPGKAYKIWHGLQEPKPSEMHEIAAILNIRPHELMMHPDDAMRIRRIEATLAEVAKPAATPDVVEAAPVRASGRG